MTERVAGISRALPAPMKARATISQAAFPANAPAPEAAPNSARPARSVVRGPKRSASAPPAKRVPAKTRRGRWPAEPDPAPAAVPQRADAEAEVERHALQPHQDDQAGG